MFPILNNMKLFFYSFIILFVSNVNAWQTTEAKSCHDHLLNTLSNSIEVQNLEKIGALYHKNRYVCIWDAENIDQLVKASEEKMLNYDKKAYHTEVLKRLLSKREVTPLSGEELARLELLASDQFLQFAKDLYEGQIDQKAFQAILHESEEEKHYVWEPNPRIPNYLNDLQVSLSTHLVQKLLERYIPQEKEYRELVKAYFAYEDIKFPHIDYVKDLKEGDYGFAVVQLKKYLYVTGDLEDADNAYLEFPNFDEKLKKAVLRFQKRHYLKQNGIFDRVNVLYARKSPKEKQQKIRLNIERYKLFPRVKGDTYIVINIPGFWLHFYKDNTLLEDIFVVIGREDRPTPIFSDYLEYVVLNPTWSIPQNLMKKDYIPHLVENPTSLLEDDIHIYQGGREVDPTKVDWSKYLDREGNVPFQMIQKAGEKNVLGEMKFIFPNKYNVYLHDTNAKKLTTRRYRLYSSGCIRLSQPYVLLSLLAPYTHYSYEQMVDMIHRGKTVHVKLRRKIPIHIRYLTAFVDEEGRVNFRKDFYGYDKIQEKLLAD